MHGVLVVGVKLALREHLERREYAVGGSVAPDRACLLGETRVAVARVTEIRASSPEGFREAVEEGVERAARTLRNITGLEVVKKRVKVERGLIVEYRVDMKVVFVLE